MRGRPIHLHRALFVLLSLLLAMPARGQDRDVNALRVALVLNIIRFVDFPPKTHDAPLLLCVERNDPNSAGLMALNGLHVGRQAIAVHPVAEDNFTNCDVAYLGKTTPPVIAKAQQPGQLLIGEGSRFISDGGMVGLVQTGTQIRFEINARVARNAHVNISSQLLRLASRVQQ
jgi:hypothetical protein